MVTDPISDMLVRITNASRAGKPSLSLPYSDMKIRLANVLLAEGFVSSVTKKAKKGDVAARWIDIGLKYEDANARMPRISGIERVSKPSRRVYTHVADIRGVRQGHGIMLLSTPKGIMTDTMARKEHVGGEVICKVW